MTALLRPRSVALVGASDRSNWSVNTLANLRRWSPSVRVELVHPTRPQVLGLPTVRSLSELAEPVDLAYVMAPRESVPDIVREAGALGIGGVVVLTAGFGETEDGVVWQQRLTQAAIETGVALLGPNGSGFVDVRRSIVPFGLQVPVLPDPGRAAFVLQSGGLMKPVLAQARAWGVGVDVVIGTGNEAVLSATDVAHHLLDSDIGAVGMFLEGFRDPAGLRELAHRALRLDRPLVVLPVGRTELAKQAALSHTGALAGDAAVTSAVLRDLGVVEVGTLEDLIATTGLLATGFRPRGNRIAVVGASGGAGELIADAAADNGLTLPPFDGPTQRAMRELLPTFSTVANPLDVTGYATVDPTLPVRVVSSIAGHDAADVVLFQAFVTPADDPPDPNGVRDHFASIAKAADGVGCPVLLQDEVGVGMGDFARTLFTGLGLVRLPGVDIGLRAIGHAVRLGAQRHRLLAARAPADPEVPAGAAPRAQRWTEPQTLAALAAFGLPVVPHAVVDDAATAQRAAADFGGLVALKVVSSDIAHKTDAGGVLLDVGVDRVAQSYRQLRAAVAAHSPQARIDGVLVAPMRPDGLELIVGVHRDPVWGPILMVGFGGVLVEVLDDVAVRPLSAEPDVDAMLDELRGAKLFSGLRGRPGVDRSALAAAVTALARAASAWGESWTSIEVNPLWLHGDQVEALDALVVPAEPDHTDVVHHTSASLIDA